MGRALPSRGDPIPCQRQIEQAAERPADDPHGRLFDQVQIFQPRKHRRQRDIGDHRARGPGAGAEMRAGAEGDAL
jgi:hypothetical protein